MRQILQAVTLLVVAFNVSGCVVGPILRLSTWHKDPSPFLIAMAEKSDCTVVFNGVLIPNLRGEYATIPEGPFVRCMRTGAFAPGEKSANVFVSMSGDKKMDLSQPTTQRNGPFILESGVDRVYPFIVTLDGLRFGATLFCPAELEISWYRAVFNAGVDKDLHVIVGEGSRQCRFTG